MTTDPPCTWAQAIEDGNMEKVEELEDEILVTIAEVDVGISAPALAFALVSDLQNSCATHADARASLEALILEMRSWLEDTIEHERKTDYH